MATTRPGVRAWRTVVKLDEVADAAPGPSLGNDDRGDAPCARWRYWTRKVPPLQGIGRCDATLIVPCKEAFLAILRRSDAWSYRPKSVDRG